MQETSIQIDNNIVKFLSDDRGRHIDIFVNGIKQGWIAYRSYASPRGGISWWTHNRNPSNKRFATKRAALQDFINAL